MDEDTQTNLPSSANKPDYRRALSSPVQANDGPTADADDEKDAADKDKDKRKARLWAVIRDKGRHTYGEVQEELTTIEENADLLDAPMVRILTNNILIPSPDFIRGDHRWLDAHVKLMKALELRPELAEAAFDAAANGMRGETEYIPGQRTQTEYTKLVAMDTLDNILYGDYGYKVGGRGWGGVVEKRPDLVNRAVSIFDRALTDKSPDVRASALGHLATIAEYRPELIDTLLDHANKNVKDSNWQLRDSAQGVLPTILHHRPDKIDSVMNLLESGAADPEAQVRLSNERTLAEILKERPDLADTFLKLAKIATADSDAGVRAAAFDTLSRIVEARSDLADTVLSLAKQGVADRDDWYVRSRALETTAMVAEKRQDLRAGAAAIYNFAAKDSVSYVRDDAKYFQGCLSLAEKSHTALVQDHLRFDFQRVP